jgi:hypothetical protein
MSAHFELCRCGKHGRLVTASGTRDLEAEDKSMAMAWLHSGRKRGEFTDDEFAILSQQIADSNLPRSGGRDAQLTKMVDQWNAALARGERLDHTRFHEHFSHTVTTTAPGRQVTPDPKTVAEALIDAAQSRDIALAVSSIMAQTPGTLHADVMMEFFHLYRNTLPSQRSDNLIEVRNILRRGFPQYWDR